MALKFPEKIDDTPENIARKVIQTPKPKKWKFLEEAKKESKGRAKQN